MRTFRGFCKDESGATAIEYGLLAALIGIGIIGSVKGLGSGTNGFYGKWTDEYVKATK